MCILAANCFAACAQTSVIKWSAGRKLTWKDFSRLSDSALPGNNDAVTHTYYAHTILVKNNRHRKTANIHLYTGFSRNSAVKYAIFALPEDRQDYLLNHEQKHFDLAEVFRRAMMQDISSKKFTRNYKEEIKAIVAKRQQAFNKEQLLYDRETEHGMNKAAQVLWNNAIAQQLTNSKKFAGTNITIEIHQE